MKKIFVLFIYISLFHFVCYSQTLQGIVLDADTKEPVIGANVYLNGTTMGAATDKQGMYSIQTRNRIHTQLIISYIGYEKTMIDNPFDSLPDTIYIKESDFKLGEVTVKGRPTFSEKQKMKAFNEQFLGTSIAAHSCKILNEKDIKLVYDAEKNTLNGYANVPIVVVNRYLGYKVLWELMEFTLLLNDKKSLHPSNVAFVSIVGTASFEDISNARGESVYLNREMTYHFSRNRFFHLLANNQLYESNIKLYDYAPKGKKLGSPYSFSKWFEITTDSTDESIINIALNPEQKDSLGITSIVVATVKPNETKGVNSIFAQMMEIRFTTSSSSIFHFLTDTFSVDYYGNTDMIKNLIIDGSMGLHRVSNQLPLDYLPPKIGITIY